MKLRELAHARTGDKGSVVNISVIAYDSSDYPHLARHLTAGMVEEFFAGLIAGPVDRYEVESLGALNFVLHGAIETGVTRTLALDVHGKSLSCAMLNIDLPDPQAADSARAG